MNTYLTEYTKNGQKFYGPDIEANSFDQAKMKASLKGIKGLKVIGIKR